MKGPIIGAPDELGLYEAAVYAELIPLLTTATRARDEYTLDQVATVLAAVGLASRPLTTAELTTALGGWGKGERDNKVFATAGAAVRALSARRGQVLYPGADVDAMYLDPLQTVLVLAHATSRFAKAQGSKPKAQGLGVLDRVLGTGVAHADPGPCGELAELFKISDTGNGFINAQAEAGRDFLQGQLVDRLSEGVLPAGGKVIFNGAKEVAGRAGATIGAIMLMLGARLELTSDRPSTHFKHEARSRSDHVTLTALATYDFDIPLKMLECYSLAGARIPKKGPLEGYTIRWDSRQPQFGTIQKGGAKLLQAVSADAVKLLRGAKTDGNGKTTLELKPPVENPAEEGEKLKEYATFIAQLDKENFPFELGDVFSLLSDQLGFAVGKTFDLLKDVLTKAGLPAQSITIEVKYHGADIIVAKGSGELNLVLVNIPKLYIDMISCTGPEGPFKGSGGYSGSESSGMLQTGGQLAGIPVPKSLPGEDVPINPPVKTHVGGGVPDAPFHIVPGEGGKWFLDGRMWIKPDMYLNNSAVKLDDRRVGRPVGEVELLPAGKSFPFNDLRWPVVRVMDDPRCTTVEYYFDDL